MSRYKFQPSKGVSLFQEGVSPGLLEKKRGKKKEKKERDIKKRKRKKKKIKREKKKERKEEGESGREPATFTQNSIRSWLHTHKQLTHAYNQENASLPFQPLLLHSTRHHRSNSETSILYAGGKYTRVSKGKVLQSFTHTYFYMNRAWSCKYMLPLFMFVCSGLVVS